MWLYERPYGDHYVYITLGMAQFNWEISEMRLGTLLGPSSGWPYEQFSEVIIK